MPFLKDSLFLISSWNRNEQSCMQFSGLRSWKRAPAWIPFSDSLQWLSSVTLYLKDYLFYCNWWNFILLNGWVIILLKIYKHAFLQIKYPCFTQDLGPLRPSCWLWSPGPSLRRLWQSLTLNHGHHEPTEGICQVGDKSLLRVDTVVHQGQNGS